MHVLLDRLLDYVLVDSRVSEIEDSKRDLGTRAFLRFLLEILHPIACRSSPEKETLSRDSLGCFVLLFFECTYTSSLSSLTLSSFLLSMTEEQSKIFSSSLSTRCREDRESAKKEREERRGRWSEGREKKVKGVSRDEEPTHALMFLSFLSFFLPFCRFLWVFLFFFFFFVLSLVSLRRSCTDLLLS